MTIGVPLLAILDVPKVRSVVAHEIGHAEKKHTLGLTRLVEFERSFDGLFEFMPVETTISGGVMYVLLGRVGEWLKDEMHRLGWKAEYEADAVAAAKVGKEATAETLAVVGGAANFYQTEILDRIDKSLLGSMAVPPSPCSQLLSRLPEIRNAGTLRTWAVREFESKPDLEASHPPVSKRLEALGLAGVPSFGAFNVSALDLVVGEEMQNKVLQDYESKWVDHITSLLNLE